MQITLDSEIARYILESFNKKKVKNELTKEIIDIFSAQLHYYDCSLFPFDAVELNEIILSYLDINDALSFLRVNKQMRKIDSDDHFWRSNVSYDFGFDPLPYLTDMNCKSCYKELACSNLSPHLLAIMRGYIPLLKKNEKVFKEMNYTKWMASSPIPFFVTAIERGHIEVIKLFVEWEKVDIFAKNNELLYIIANNIPLVKFFVENQAKYRTTDFSRLLIDHFLTNHGSKVAKTGKLDDDMIIKFRRLLGELNPEIAVVHILRALNCSIDSFKDYTHQILAGVFSEKLLSLLNIEDISIILSPLTRYSSIIIYFIVNNVKHINITDIIISSDNDYAIEILCQRMTAEDRIKYFLHASRTGNKALWSSLNKVGIADIIEKEINRAKKE